MSNAAVATKPAESTCLRCGGSGKTRFKHVDGGVCYGCNGRGKAEVRVGKYVAPRRNGRPTWCVVSVIDDRDGNPERYGHQCDDQAMARQQVDLLRRNAKRDGIVIGIEVRNPAGEIVHTEEAW